jgi:hypothetical protein
MGILLADQESSKPETSMKQNTIRKLERLHPKIVRYTLIFLLLVITIILSAGVPLLTRSPALF